MMLNDMHRRATALKKAFNRAAQPGRERVRARLIVGRVMARLRSDEEGQAIVETALMLGMLMLAVVSISWFGITMYNRTLLTQAVQAGASEMVAYQTLSTDPCTAATTAIQNATGGTTGLTYSQMTVTFYENGAQVSGSSCAGNLSTGDTVTVSATYPSSLGPYFGNTTLFATLTLPVN